MMRRGAAAGNIVQVLYKLAVYSGEPRPACIFSGCPVMHDLESLSTLTGTQGIKYAVIYATVSVLP